MNMDQLRFEELGLEGVRTLVRWADGEGWDPGPHDAEIFFGTDPRGFCGYFLGDELIAGGAIISYGGEFGFMGLFIVKPDYRGRGIGRKLWFRRRDTLLSRLKEGSPIGIDGVVAMQPFYERGGFRIAFRDERHERIGSEFSIDGRVSGIGNEDRAAILSYDRRLFGFSRPQFLGPWLEMPESRSFKLVEDGELKGFAVLRKTRRGHKIGPLFAESRIAAEELYRACLNSAVGELVYLDIPMFNREAVEMVREYGATYVFECARMYYGNPPEVNIGKVFGITTFELG